MDILYCNWNLQWWCSVSIRQKIVADWRLLGDEKFGVKYDDDGDHSTGLIPARLVYNNSEYTNLDCVSAASCFVHDWKFNNEKQPEGDNYQIHYIWAD